jgi:hypothetical protein
MPLKFIRVHVSDKRQVKRIQNEYILHWCINRELYQRSTTSTSTRFVKRNVCCICLCHPVLTRKSRTRRPFEYEIVKKSCNPHDDFSRKQRKLAFFCWFLVCRFTAIEKQHLKGNENNYGDFPRTRSNLVRVLVLVVAHAKARRTREQLAELTASRGG